MATPLSDANKALIRTFLGYPNLYRYKNVRLEGALQVIDSDDGAQPIVLDLIAKIQNNDTQIEAAADQLGVKKVDEIELFGASKDSTDTMSRLFAKGRRYIGHLSVLLGVPINADYYSGKGYPGDSFSDGGMGTENGFSSSFETRLG